MEKGDTLMGENLQVGDKVAVKGHDFITGVITEVEADEFETYYAVEWDVGDVDCEDFWRDHDLDLEESTPIWSDEHFA